MKLLIISFLFPPSHNVGALRVGKTVKHLLALGYDVRVITASNSLYPLGLPLEIPAERVVYTKWIDVNNPFYWIKDEFNDKGVDSTKYNADIASFFYTALRDSYKFCFHRPDSVIGWLPFALRAGDALFKSWIPDVIYASAAPYTSLVVAKILSRRYGIPWVAELRDLWADNAYKRSDFIGQRIERNTLLSASALVTVSDGLCCTLQTKYQQPCHVVRNAFDSEDMVGLSQIDLSKKTVNIIYTGTVYKGMQNPSILFKAVSQSSILKSKISISFYGGNHDWIKYSADSYGIGENVRLYPVISRDKSLGLQKSSDLLLLLTWNNPAEQGFIPAKLFEYIGIGKPIIAVGDYYDEVTKIICDNSFGLAFNDQDTLAEYLLHFIENPHQLSHEAVINREKFTRIHQVEKLSEIFKSVVEPDIILNQKVR